MAERTPSDVERERDAQGLEAHLRRHRPLLLLSPPRANSSAFATALGQSSALHTYIHEPAGLYSYEDVPISNITEALTQLDDHTLIKEMTFQIRDRRVARAFLTCCQAPVVFLVRSPLLTIESRVRLVLGDLAQDPATSEADRKVIAAAIEARSYGHLDRLVTEALFPLFRTGWLDLGEQLGFCRDQGVPHLVVETSDFRRAPGQVLGALCRRLGLAYEPQMATWESGAVRLSGALDRHQAWYRRVASSSGVQPPDAHAPKAQDLPPRFQQHLPEAMEIYRSALSDPSTLIRA